MNSLNDILNSFEPISLDEMDSVKLMNRTDTKFIMNKEQLHKLLYDLKDNYRVLEVKGKRISSYNSLYYDTDKFDLYTRHQNGKMNRYKVRYRKYVESSLSFLEIKFKSNKGRTIKNRIKTTDLHVEIPPEEKAFISEKTTLNPEKLIPSLYVDFSRITLVHKKDKERLTLDTGLTFRDPSKSNEKCLTQLIIAEIKQEKFTSDSDFIRTAHKHTIRPMRISKYCIGSAILNERLKYNRFKKKLLTINKMHYVDANEDIWKRAV